MMKIPLTLCATLLLASCAGSGQPYSDADLAMDLAIIQAFRSAPQRPQTAQPMYCMANGSGGWFCNP